MKRQIYSEGSNFADAQSTADVCPPVRAEKQHSPVDLNQFDIVHLFGKEKLEDIQRTISKVTGLAFVTVDFKGEPVTEATYFSRFCWCMRKNPVTEQICWSSDAYGAVQGTIRKKPSVYFCPCGLLEVAIPLIVRGHYLGGFIGGQVVCHDAPEGVVHLDKILMRPDIQQEANIDYELQDEMTKLTYDQFINVVDLAAMIINQLTESELAKFEKSRDEKRDIEELEREIDELRYQNKLKSLEISSMNYARHPQFIINTMTSIANLAIVEGAEETSEAAIKFSEYMKSLYLDRSDFWTMEKELDNVELYLEIQKIRMGDRLNYSIELPGNMRMQRIPSNTLPVFVEQAIIHGVGLKEEGGTVLVRVGTDGEDVVIYVEDDGPGYTNEQFEEIYGRLDNNDSCGVSQSVEVMSRRMRILFGREYDVTTEVTEGTGRRVCIRYPKYLDEGVRQNVSNPNRRR